MMEKTWNTSHNVLWERNGTNGTARLECNVMTTPLIILYSLAALFTTILLIGNAFILMFTLNRKRKSTYDILLIYLSTFDFLAAFTMIPRIYTEMTMCSSKWKFGYIGCKILLPFYDVSVNISVCILIIISLDRCRTLTRPLRSYGSPISIHTIALSCIVLSVIVYFERFMKAEVRGGVCNYVLDGSLINLSPVLVWAFRDVTFLVVFTTTSLLIRNSFKKAPDLSEQQMLRKKVQSKKVYKNLLMMQITFSVLVLPFDVLSISSLGFVMIHKQRLTWQPFELLSKYLFLLQMSNSLANCFIYSRIHYYIKTSRKRFNTTSREQNNNSNNNNQNISKYQKKDELYEKK
uniref:GPCR2 n=1 Tax=Clytia hemisphaerica TaxID=252671 RepID=A0A4P2SXQ4_9CNID|nr:GPCR2 [Clytia hemisphaerica]